MATSPSKGMGSPSPSSRSLATSFQTSYVDDIQDIDTSCAVEQHIISFVEDHTKTKGSQEIAINKYAKQMEKATAWVVVLKCTDHTKVLSLEKKLNFQIDCRIFWVRFSKFKTVFLKIFTHKFQICLRP